MPERPYGGSTRGPLYCGGLRLTLILVLLLGTGACDTVTDSLMSPFQKKIGLNCPPHAIVADASRRLDFRNANGRDLTDIDTEIILENLILECESDLDRKTRAGTLTTKVGALFNAVRGPANTSRETEFEYFVSVTDLADKVLYREAFTVKVRFAENELRRVVGTTPVTLEIPIQSGQTEGAFRILVGMVLTREQLELNRKDRRPRL